MTTSDEGPGTWSPYQVVGHLTSVEETDWIDRTRLILKHGTERVFDPVDREAGFTRYRGWSLGDLLDRFAVAKQYTKAIGPWREFLPIVDSP